MFHKTPHPLLTVNSCAISYDQDRDGFINLSLAINREGPGGNELCSKLQSWLERNDLWLKDDPDGKTEAEFAFEEEGIVNVFVPLADVAKFSTVCRSS